MARIARTANEMDESQFERMLTNTARIALVLIGFAVLLVVLQAGRVILAPVTLAIVIGLMFGPVADRLEGFAIPPALSAGVVVLLLLAVIFGGVALFAVPLSEWVARAPAIWEKLQSEISALREPMESVAAFQEQLTSLFGSASAMAVTV